MPKLTAPDFPALYTLFETDLSAIDCGKKCAPYNQGGVPFCCDTHHAVPTAYTAEMEYLLAHTDLWHTWQAHSEKETMRMQAQLPPGQVLCECLGHKKCIRPFRTLTCRAFPFFPYIDHHGRFLGLSGYWEYEDRCWVISHLEAVTPAYRAAFMRAYEAIFAAQPDELENFSYHSKTVRKVLGKKHRAILLLHRNGKNYKVTPHNGRLRKLDEGQLPKYGPYKIAALLPFPDE